MPKLIDYPRTSYSGAWEVAEVVDDTGGKCALETCARKLNRKVSGSFKAIVGSAVKFGLLTSKREVLTTTTLFRRIKHAYDKQEELLFHREAFLTPPLFTQLCRKFRSRELPVAMLDVLLIREFDVEEINAQGVSKAFVDGARMVNLLDENNVIADIDQLAAQQAPRRELANPIPSPNVFRQMPPARATTNTPVTDSDEEEELTEEEESPVSTDAAETPSRPERPIPRPRPAPATTTDAIANLFGFTGTDARALPSTPTAPPNSPYQAPPTPGSTPPATTSPTPTQAATTQRAPLPIVSITPPANQILFRVELTGPGINTQLDVTEIEDLSLIRALLDKIERQLRK
ncbi:hypothetical protein E4631_15775 [Hymenobacter sp. UV11]|uniref:hypothetical protein n=1 Tax=Hymenobacter sp. UV11 TaxID=1849735 RepID=UPI00105DAD7C|nr:hypothetical protein [Hymenobacter sp. UV11]TDN39245.1 hypothetical protein A8B98_18465 [Hymenobacter sp. UV11]TFZ65675.1 hypothetical protein E4631_15775 [Hymenobacter sp. UV11]